MMVADWGWRDECCITQYRCMSRLAANLGEDKLPKAAPRWTAVSRAESFVAMGERHDCARKSGAGMSRRDEHDVGPAAS